MVSWLREGGVVRSVLGRVEAFYRKDCSVHANSIRRLAPT